MNTFELNTPEDWFNRLVRHLLGKRTLFATSNTLDVVSHSIETPYNDPETCADAPDAHYERQHRFDRMLVHNDHEHCYRCTKCGAIMRTVWRDQPGFWSVVVGRKA